jgi:hypothetical protein
MMKTFLVRMPQLLGWGLRVEATSESHAALRAALWSIRHVGPIGIPSERFEITECHAGGPFETADTAQLAELERWLITLIDSCPELRSLRAAAAA